ncbi:hypothetical protein [Oceanobacillus sp. 1P07AA]|uniref:hypothetical protein n=1 Tax=Oceanobacillus sp. 1P07AA TaxID=3132293 RepID=UPI0039A645B5
MRKIILFMFILMILLVGCRQEEVSRETATVQFTLIDRYSEPIRGVTTVVTERFDDEPVSDIGMIIEESTHSNVIEADLTVGKTYHFAFQKNEEWIHEEEISVSDNGEENKYTIVIEE